MVMVSIEVPDELPDLVAQVGDRLPELLARILKEPTVPTHVYRYVLDFLAARLTPDEVAGFVPTPEMTGRLQTLLEREAKGEATPVEKAELDEYERPEHLMVMIKAGSLRYLTGHATRDLHPDGIAPPGNRARTEPVRVLSAFG